MYIYMPQCTYHTHAIHSMQCIVTCVNLKSQMCVCVCVHAVCVFFFNVTYNRKEILSTRFAGIQIDLIYTLLIFISDPT